MCLVVACDLWAVFCRFSFVGYGLIGCLASGRCQWLAGHVRGSDSFMDGPCLWMPVWGAGVIHGSGAIGAVSSQ